MKRITGARLRMGVFVVALVFHLAYWIERDFRWTAIGLTLQAVGSLWMLLEERRR